MNSSQAGALERWSSRYLVGGLSRLDAGLKRAPRNPRDLPSGEPLGMRLAPQDPVDWAGMFGRSAPLAVEVGSGMGENLAAMAVAHPDWDLIGFEVYDKALGSTMGRLAAVGADNVRLVQADGVTGLEHLFAPGSLERVWTYFPDPWPKPRHHKRRLISTDFAALVLARLAEGGEWRIATDWEDYAAHIREVLARTVGFVDMPIERRERPVTKFEQRALDDGRPITEFRLVKSGSR
jgi:tRNA (guanine-N7-)-methyltransferase